MNNLIDQFNSITKMKVFEIEVKDVRTNEDEYILFNIEIDAEKNILKASHIALTIDEEKSKFIAVKSIDLDETFSMDEHLQELYSACIDAIISSDFYKLVD